MSLFEKAAVGQHLVLRVITVADWANARTLNKWVSARVFYFDLSLVLSNNMPSTSLLAEEKVWEEVCHVLIELILRGQQHRLVVDEQQQQVEEEQQHNASQHHQDGRDAVLLGNDTCFGIQWLQQVRQTSANAIAFWQGVALSIGCGLLGVADWEVASFGRHTHLTSLTARIHEAHLAAEGPQAQASKGIDPWLLIWNSWDWNRKKKSVSEPIEKPKSSCIVPTEFSTWRVSREPLQEAGGRRRGTALWIIWKNSQASGNKPPTKRTSSESTTKTDKPYLLVQIYSNNFKYTYTYTLTLSRNPRKGKPWNLHGVKQQGSCTCPFLKKLLWGSTLYCG